MRITENDRQAMLAWLANHRAALDAGVNIGQIDRDKAQRFTLSILHGTR